MSNRLVPPLATDHPGYFKVVLSLVLIHVALTFDALHDGLSNSPAFLVVIEALHGQVWVLALIHSLIAVLLVTGLYWREHFALMRYGCALSLVMFNVLAVGLATASLIYNLSYYSAMASVTLSLSSLAALKEPPIQAARRE